MSETINASRPKFIGTLRLERRVGLKTEAEPAPPAPPVTTAAAEDETAQRVADLTLCRERFPAVFDADRPLPLAIRVHEPLAEVIGSPERARAVLEWWTGWPPYLRAVAAGGKRYHLDGAEAGAITERHREVARVTLAGRAAAGKPSGPSENAKTG